MIDQFGFWIVAVCLILSGYKAVTCPRLVHSVLWLAMTLVATAVMYLLLSAPFLAGIQIILYAGGVITLMLFGVMMTDHKHDVDRTSPSHRKVAGAVAAMAVFGLIFTSILRTPLLEWSTGSLPSVAQLGETFLTTYQLAFETLSLLLLAAMLGAIVLARRNDP